MKLKEIIEMMEINTLAVRFIAAVVVLDAPFGVFGMLAFLLLIWLLDVWCLWFGRFFFMEFLLPRIAPPRNTSTWGWFMRITTVPYYAVLVIAVII